MKIIGRYAYCACLGLLGVLPSTAQTSKKGASLESNNMIASAGTQKVRFALEGTLKGLPVLPEKLYLIYDSLSGKPADSAIVVNGKYKFTGVLDEPVMATISPKWFDSKNQYGSSGIDVRNMAKVFLDKGTIKATSNGYIHKINISGSVANDAFNIANNRMVTMEDSAQDLARLFRETQDRYYYDQVLIRAFSMDRPVLADYISYISKHPTASINPYLVNNITGMLSKGSPGQADSVLAMFNRMPVALKESVTGKIAGKKLNKEMKIAIGHQAAGFNLPDEKGGEVSLAGLKGKYVLIFFQYGAEKSTDEVWLANAFQTYKDKGLTMICIALNTDRPTWETGTRGRTTPWVNLWSGKGTPDDIESLYNVTNARGNLLIDPAGIIIARNLNGTDIQRTLSDVLD